MNGPKVYPIIEHPLKDLPFKMVPNSTEVVQHIPSEYEQTHYCFVSCLKSFTKAMWRISGRLISIRSLLYLFCFIPVCALMGHIGYIIHLIKTHDDEDETRRLIPLLIVAIGFFISTFITIFCLIKNGQYPNEASVIYLGIFFAYTILFCSHVSYLSSTERRVSLILFACGINLLGAATVMYHFWLLFYAFALMIEYIIRHKCSNCCPPPGLSIRSYNAYYFDPVHTSATCCMICLNGLAENNEVCIGKCHISHVFHRICISEWFNVKDTCPMCNCIARFY